MPGMAITKRDFSHVKNFPGTHGNSFDVVLRVADFFEGLPRLLFALVLLLPAALIVLLYRTWWPGLVLWLFTLSDWPLLAGLPRAGRSFGPAKPPAVMLAVPRFLVA